MRRTWIAAMIAAALVVAGPGAAIADERYEDAVGDMDGDAPDIIAVTVSEPDEAPAIRLEIELGPDRPFGTDMETWTDSVFVLMSDKPDVDERGILAGDHYLTGTHGVTLESQAETGAILLTPEDMYHYVVDLETADDTLTFTLDRKLIGNPLDLYFQVLLGVERDGAEEGEEMDGDAYPDEGEPPAVYRIGATDW